MDDPALNGIILAVVMIFLMFLPNLLFRPPENHEEIRDEYIRDMIRRSEAEIEKKKQNKKQRKQNSPEETQDYYKID